MENVLLTYLLIMVGYWIKLIWSFPAGYSKAYLLGRAFVWPFLSGMAALIDSLSNHLKQHDNNE